ncbi:uncharacterized protein LOC116616144 isoform X2 [Nematostella vectensis]|uniref:uncharacterized protein LOC116616144 isoform X2 n=1 Tax=Nematostella vectensis TaxID=45351 RepID=UPI0013906439|nr:uncharacterized protein LOC116616144 isoform X2 [Nematostella vectensis]
MKQLMEFSSFGGFVKKTHFSYFQTLMFKKEEMGIGPCLACVLTRHNQHGERKSPDQCAWSPGGSDQSPSTQSPTSPTAPSFLAHPQSFCPRVQFLNLKQVYLKAQSRVGRESKQRLIDSRVRMIATFHAQIQQIHVYVERAPESAMLCGDHTGRVPLTVKMGELATVDKQYFSVDLDSVYTSPQGMPVYKLSTVDADKRNRFRIVVIVVCLGDTKSTPHYSRPFLIRSRRSSRQGSIS